MTETHAVKRPDAAFRCARQLQDTPPPYPSGWYAVAFSQDLRPGKLVTARFMGRDIVIFRTKSGTVRASEAYCPHLGAHLGHGGKIIGEELACPFHGFRFSANGACVSSPYGPPPPAARLGMLEVREFFDTILVWHGPSGPAPWEVELPEGDSEWHAFKRHTMQFRTHPQEVTENSVDVGHLRVLHRFTDVNLTEPLQADGPRLRTSYSFIRPLRPVGGIKVNIRIRVDGLGFSLVELSLAGGWALRQLILPTPVNDVETIVRVGTAVRRHRTDHKSTEPAWRGLEALVGEGVLFAVILELRRDRAIWSKKAYLGRPAIAAGDGPIGPYRRWAKQFYAPEGSDEAGT